MRILLPVDGSPFTRRMPAYLGAHADLFGRAAEFTLVHVQTPVPLRTRAVADKQEIDAMHAAETARATATAVAAMKRKGWKWRLVTHIGTPGEEIAQLAKRGRFDLVVMGSHGHSALGALLLGSTAQRVIASCRVPVLVVR